MTGDEKKADTGWHLDKRVNVSIIVTLVLQVLIFGALWGNLENRVTNVEMRLAQQADAMRLVPERLASMESTLLAIKERLDRFPRD